MVEDTENQEKVFVEIEKETRRKPGRPRGSKNLNYQFKKQKREEEKARKTLWKRGVLYPFLLDTNQMDLYNAYRNNERCDDLVWMTSRQIGKSWTVCTIILEEAIKNPGWKMAYIAPELGQAKEIVHQTFSQLLEDCPIELQPKFNTQTNKYIWPNGSELKLAGTDNRNANKIRGNRFHRVFIDEFAFLSEYNYVIASCVTPTITSVAGSFIVFISSPPETPDHESNALIDKAEEDGTIIKKTVHTCPRFTTEHVEKLAGRYIGGVESIDFRREYLVERIADISKLVIPEANAEKIIEIVADIEKPEFYNIFEAFDWGVMDSTGGLFAYVNFDTQQLVIVDEFLLDGIKNTTQDIAKVIHTKEHENWGHFKHKALRFADNNLQIINDMSFMHELHMMATKKDNLHSQVQKVRHLLDNNQIIIHPRCENLIEQIQSAQWDKSRKKFVRRNGHHYDLVASLIYLVRNTNLEYNPYPAGHGDETNRDKFFLSGRSKVEKVDEFGENIKKWFTVKPIRRRK